MEIKNFLSVLFVLGLSISGCNSPIEDCLTIDQVTELKTLKLDNKEHYLYLRISGWHDKVVFYVLYDKKPVFDDCMRAKTQPISDIPIYPENGTASKLIIKDKKLSLEYTKEEKASPFESIEIEIVLPKKA